MSNNNLPSYEDLFGNLDYSNADEYRSALSPAAYLADIMDLKDWHYDNDPDAVDDRRADISEILLNAENTITEIPHLDIVNDVMENRVEAIEENATGQQDVDAYAVLKDAQFPFNMPFNKDKTEIGKILEYLKTDPAKFYKAFTASPDTETEAREYLGLSTEEYETIINPIDAEIELRKFYGLKDDESLQLQYDQNNEIEKDKSLPNVKRFRKATELSALQVSELLFQDLSQAEREAGVSQRFFINRSLLTPSLYLKTKTVDEDTADECMYLVMSDDSTLIPNEYYGRIHRFIRLSRKTGLSFADLDLVLTTACNGNLDPDAIQIIAVVKWLQNMYEIPVEEICTFFSGFKDYGKGETTTPADLFSRTFNNDYDTHIDTVSGTELKTRLRACLRCNESEYDAIAEYLSERYIDIVPTPSRLALPYRIKKLATLFEIPVESLFILFALIDRNYSFIENKSMIERTKFPLPVGFPQTINNCKDIITIEEISDPDSIKNVLWLVQLCAVFMQWLNENEMTVEQLEFICTEHSSGFVEGVLTSGETKDLLRDLNGQFSSVLFKPGALVSGVTDKLTADLVYEKICDLETGVCTDRGILRGTTAAADLSPLYQDAIREKLFIEKEDLAKTALSDAELKELFLTMQNKNYLDQDEYISNDFDNIEFFKNADNVETFLAGTDFSEYAAIIFKEISQRVKAYSKANEAGESECAVIAEKISVQAGRQLSVLFGGLEDGLNVSSDIVRILCSTIFRTADETREMATVRFMTPLMEAFDREAAGGELVLDASFATSFRRLQQFSLLVSKTGLKARELEVLFFVKDVQNSLPEKLKLPAPFTQYIDAMYSDAENNIYIISGEYYVRFSGKDYSLDAIGSIGHLDDLHEFRNGATAGISAGLRDWAPNETDRQTYYFSKFFSLFCNAASGESAETRQYWGKVRNNIAENNRVNGAYRAADGTLYIFSGDQYVRYSGTDESGNPSRTYVDEGYPKNILRNWNNENQVKLPVEIRKQVESIVLDTELDAEGNRKAYFFSGDKFVDSSDSTNVQKTNERWAKVVNNIIDENKVDDVLVKDGKTYMFSGDQYTRYSSGDYTFTDEGYPRKIQNNWNNEGIIPVSGEYASRIDAALNGTDGQVYFFNNNTFISTVNGASVPVNSMWGKVLNNIELNNRVDAALVKGGKTYLFSGDQYFRYSGPDYTVLDEGYPKKIASWNAQENLGTLPDSFNTGISAAFTAQDTKSYFFSENQYANLGSGAQPALVKDAWAVVRNNIQADSKLDAGFVAPDGKTYLFRGDQFFRYSTPDYTAVDEGYPKKIQGNWGNLPDEFCEKVDAAFTFNLDGINRLYLFRGSYYVRYSGGNYSQIDAGYPKQLDHTPNPEGNWFEPIFEANPQHQYNDRVIKTIFTDQYNNKPRINYFFYDRNGVHKVIRYEYIGNHYHWSDAIPVSSLAISPFTSVDVGFTGADGKVYLFSGNDFAEMLGNYNGITAPAPVNGAWGKVVNRFQYLNRVDGAFIASGCTYLFCDTQYVKYSGDITPENANFFVDEGYPKTTATSWNGENSGIQVPATFAPQGDALLSAPDGLVYIFSGSSFTTSANADPVSINTVWGKVENNFESLNRVDAAFVHAGKTYLFSGNQYTRYSGDYSGYADEGYPKKIANIGVQDGIDIAARFPDGIKAIMDGADGMQYVFTENKYVSSSAPSISADIKSRFGIVRNNIADTGSIDAADATEGGVLYLFSGDQYVRYSAGSRESVDEGYPKAITNWSVFEGGSLPDTRIKARFTDYDGAEYFFVRDTEDDKYFTVIDGVASELSLVNTKWGKVQNNIQETGLLDAAFIAPNGKTYLFSGDQYVQYTPDASTYVSGGYPNAEGKTVYVDEGFPKKIADNWGDLPADPADPIHNYRAGIDEAFVFDGRTYFFRADTYVRYSDPACKKIDAGFPKSIAAGMSELPEFRLNDVKTFQQFKALSRSFSDTDNTFLSYLYDSRNGLTVADQRSRLSSVTEWAEAEISTLTDPAYGALSGTDLGDIQVLTEVKSLFDLSEDMASLPSTVKAGAWDKIYIEPTDLTGAAAFLTAQLKTVTGAAAWSGLSAELHNKMNLAKRNALLGYLIYRMGQDSDPAVNRIQNARDLYEYLLIDVEMGEEATASRIQEAIMCMQLFYHRLLMSLEDETQSGLLVDKEDLKNWWIWMKNYRVWEANRKVFLYPENYIRPELRLSKSPEFKELEEALLQGDITDETADDAYKQYLDKFSVISRLKIAGGYAFQRTAGTEDTSQNAAAQTEKKVIMFGYSNTEPKKYYYMTGDILEENDADGKTVQTIDWAPWKEIGITINADKVYPVFSFNRLFVFWVELRERDQSSYSSSVGPGQKKTQYDPEIYYSFYNIRGNWTNPQKMCSLASYIDQLDDTKKALFIDDKTKTGTAYIPVKDVLNGARLYVTNPITSRYYDPEEYIYISYQVRYATTSTSYEFTFEGKLKSDLEFEQGQVDTDLADKLEKNIEFPAEQFGITPTSYNHWKGYFNDSFSAPWFSFNAAGGSFLIKPAIIPNSPVLNSQSDHPMRLYGIDWNNFPDSGFTDQSSRKHLFYREDLNGSVQYYRVKDGETLSDPLSVTDEWGKRNIFVWYPEGVGSAVTNGDKTFIATAGGRYMSYTGAALDIIDQNSAGDTLNAFSLGQLLPSGAVVELWHRVKEDLGDFLDTLENAFVYSNDNRLYLVANPVNESGAAVREYTVPDVSEFWQELAALVPESSVADILRTWTSARSANFYTLNGNKRLYITSDDNVFIKDYIAGANSIQTVADLTHPDLMSTVYDATPAGAVETAWIDARTNLMDFITRLTGVGNEGGSIRLIAEKPDTTYEYTVPVAGELFNDVADIINDVNISPVVAALTELSAADFYINGSIKRLYFRSGTTAVIYDYTAGAWSVRNVDELIHPDVTAQVSSLAGLLPYEPAVPWSDVAEDFNEYMSTVQGALVWQGVFYLFRPKTGGGYEYTEFDAALASSFWGAVAETLPAVSGYTAVDSACIVNEDGTRRLYVTFNSNVAMYDFTSGAWSLSTISAMWGLGFGKIDGLIQAPDGKVYIFSGRDYAEKVDAVFTSVPVTSKWGFLANVFTLSGATGIVDAAFMDGDGRAYLFTGDQFMRYSDVDSKVMDQGYPKEFITDFGIILDEVKEEFSADPNNIVEITNIGINTAFSRNIVKRDILGNETEEEKMYLFMDVTAKITTHIWRWRWRWWGGWRWRPFWGVLYWRRSWWGWWWPEFYLEEKTETVRKSVYVRFSRSGEQYQMDVDYPKVITGNWTNLTGDFNKMITGTFEDVEVNAGTGLSENVFYALRTLAEEDGTIVNDYVKYTGKENFPKEICEEIYEIIRLTSNTSEVLSQKLFIDGIDGLLTLETQRTEELPKFEARTDQDDDVIVNEDETAFFLKDNRKNDIVLYKMNYISDVPVGTTLDFGSINGQYYWEIYFHAPFLIAQAFNNAQKFDDANTWYERIFDPTETYDGTQDASFWKFLPFQTDIADTQSADLRDPAQYYRYMNDPFDPHAIAGLRQIAYRKAIVMTYIDNLMDWGDMLFRRYTRETINEARMLYVLAYDLLGKKPELLGTKRLSEAKTYRTLREERDALIADLIAMENLPANSVNPLTGSYITPNGSLLDPYGYFYIPENREFAEYWDRVEDRLYKIRYSLNLDGVKQLLPLFEPPIDVMALVRAVGSGMGLAQALADFNVAVPHYRFTFILAKARELTSRLTQFGQSLLSALEKKDAEELALLRNTHEKAIMKLALDIKKAQLEDAQETVNALRANLKGAKTREAHYNMLLASGLSPFETNQLGMLASAQLFMNLSQVFAISSSVSGIMPEAGVFAFHWGGHNLAALFTGLSQSFNAISGNMSYRANLASILGGFFRRAQDWTLQKQLASCDIENIERQIAGAEIKVKVARLDIQTAETNIKNLESVDTFMKGKFTNLQLYRWMAGKLAGLYFQTYQMALDLAKWAQKSFQFELGYKESEVSFISSLYWDSLKKGLLAGETLQVDLDRMEKAYLEKNGRRFEISKTISLQQLDPLALLNLREKRVCEFTLGEELFDYDFPGHYRRQIKTVSLTFPAVAGPYENINATLTQLSHRTLIDPDKNALDYLLNFITSQPASVRADWRTNQQIALSRGVNDSGLFQLNFQDERYLPFEGTGAVSTWRLELNGQENSFDMNTLSDVIIKIEYTALQGGETFAAAVKKKLKASPAAKVFNLSQDFSAEWNSFMENPSGGLNIKVTKEMFPNMSSQVTGLYMLFALSKDGVKDLGDTAMDLTASGVTTRIDQAKLTNAALSISSSGSSWKLVPASNAEYFTPENISNIALVCVYTKKPQF